MEASGFIEIIIRGYEKYKPRADIKDPWWFKCANRLFDDDDLFDFSLEEMAVWVYIMGIASQQKSARVRISIRKASARIPPGLLRSTVAKLADLGIVSYPCAEPGQEPDGSRTDHVHEPGESCAQEEKGIEGKGTEGGEHTAAFDAPPPPADASPGGEFGVAPELAGGPFLETALSTVPMAVQASWLERYDPGWLKASLIKCIEHQLGKRGVKWPTAIPDWPKHFGSWLSEERQPKYRHQPRAPSAASPPIHIPPASAEEALTNLTKLPYLGAKARGALERKKDAGGLA